LIVRQLQYVIALAREKHFARAAAVCHVSQPTLSAGIQQLETDLGVQIVKRGRRFLGFTESGELVLSWAQRMTNEAEGLRQKLKERAGNFAGTLRVGVMHSAIPLVKLFTVPFQQQYPEMNLRITHNDAFGIQEAIEAGSLDVAITYLGKKSGHYARKHVLYTEEYELLIRRGTCFSGRSSVRWEDIRQLPLCLMSPNTRLFGAKESEILNDALSKTPHIVTGAIWLVMDHVRTGKWASVLPRPVLIMIRDDEELEAIPLPSASANPTVGIVLPRIEPQSEAAEAFFEIATAKESLKTLTNLLRSSHDSSSRPAQFQGRQSIV